MGANYDEWTVQIHECGEVQPRSHILWRVLYSRCVIERVAAAMPWIRRTRRWIHRRSRVLAQVMRRRLARSPTPSASGARERSARCSFGTKVSCECTQRRPARNDANDAPLNDMLARALRSFPRTLGGRLSSGAIGAWIKNIGEGQEAETDG